jgi:hypothetical protein
MTDKLTPSERVALLRASLKNRAPDTQSGDLSVPQTKPYGTDGAARRAAAFSVPQRRSDSIAQQLAVTDPGYPPAWVDRGDGVWLVYDPLRVADAMQLIVDEDRSKPPFDPCLRLGHIHVHWPSDGQPIQLMCVARLDVEL